MTSNQDKNLDKLLSDLKSEYKISNTMKKTNKNDQTINSLLEEVKSEINSNQSSKQVNHNNVINHDSEINPDIESIRVAVKNQQDDNSVNSLFEAVKSEINGNQSLKQVNPNNAINHNSESNPDIESIRVAVKNQQDDNSVNSLLEEVKSEINSNQSLKQVTTNNTINYNSKINQDIESIKAKYKNNKNQQKRQAESIYNRNKQEIINQEQQKQVKRKQLIRQAEQWLANLDPISDEGIWFNQLAESYPTKLEAAISYLETLNQPNS